MKQLKALSVLVLGIFLISFASATVVGGGSWEETGTSKILEINEGDSIVFNIDFYSTNPPMKISVKLCDSSDNRVYHTFEKFENNYYTTPLYSLYKIYTITPDMYGEPGTYQVTLIGRDNDGDFTATPLYLTVIPVEEPEPEPEEDTTAPIITLTGDSEVTINVGDSYIDEGATAIDYVDGDLTSSIIVINPVNTDFVETYIVTYNVQDSAGNSAEEVTRTVNVIEDEEDDEDEDEDDEEEEDKPSKTSGLYEGDSFYEQLYLDQFKPKTVYLEEELEEQLSWFQRLINWLKRLFGWR